MDPTKCMVCQGSLGLHPMKVRVEGRVGRICNRVNKQHADWLLDRKMDSAYLRISYRRRGGLLGIIILMMAFILLLWVFAYTMEFKGPIVAAATFVTIVIGGFLMIEFSTITVGDRMRKMLTEADIERPIRSERPSAALETLDELARPAVEEPPLPDPFASDLPPAPTSASPQRAVMMAENGIPGIPQPVIAAKEWQVMAEDGGAPGPAAQPASGAPAPQPPSIPIIEDLPDSTAPSQAPPPVATTAPVPPVAPPPIAPATTLAPPPPPQPPQVVQTLPPPPPAAAPQVPVEELPATVDQRPPPSTMLSPPAPARTPPPLPPATPVVPAAPAPPVPQQYQTPPAQRPPAQQQPSYQQPPVQQPPAQQPAPAQPPQPQRPKKTPQEEADEWVVDWE